MSSTERVFIGIDPGVKGAAVVLSESGQVQFHGVPTRTGTSGTDYLDGEMALILAPYAAEPSHYCTLEECSIRQGESGRSGLKIGRGWGLWKGILVALTIPHSVALPHVWSKEFSLPVGLKGPDRQKAIRARAQELFPHLTAKLAAMRPDYSAALLLAEYGRRKTAGKAGG